jgi:RHS repeat-associated protein
VRLAQVTAAGVTTTYTLDGLGNRWAETTGGVTTAFDLDLGQANPTVLYDGVHRYLPGAPGAGYDTAGVWWSSLTDLVGTPILSVSETGATTSPVHRDPYGNPRPGSVVTAGIGYAGEWRDPAGLLNLRARAYDPATGRFTARDTFGGGALAPQTGNRYAYALANPYRYTDPSGRFVNFAISNGPLITSLVVQSLPGVGDAYSFLTGVLGYDPIAGVGQPLPLYRARPRHRLGRRSRRRLLARGQARRHRK